MIKCTKCGYEMLDDCLYCPNCGADYPAYNEVDRENKKLEDKLNKSMSIGCIFLIIVYIGMIIAIFYGLSKFLSTCSGIY